MCLIPEGMYLGISLIKKNCYYYCEEGINYMDKLFFIRGNVGWDVDKLFIKFLEPLLSSWTRPYLIHVYPCLLLWQRMETGPAIKCNKCQDNSASLVYEAE